MKSAVSAELEKVQEYSRKEMYLKRLFSIMRMPDKCEVKFPPVVITKVGKELAKLISSRDLLDKKLEMADDLLFAFTDVVVAADKIVLRKPWMT